jgi:hypothetical protein
MRVPEHIGKDSLAFFVMQVSEYTGGRVIIAFLVITGYYKRFSSR